MNTVDNLFLSQLNRLLSIFVEYFFTWRIIWLLSPNGPPFIFHRKVKRIFFHPPKHLSTHVSAESFYVVSHFAINLFFASYELPSSCHNSSSWNCIIKIIDLWPQDKVPLGWGEHNTVFNMFVCSVDLQCRLLARALSVIEMSSWEEFVKHQKMLED